MCGEIALYLLSVSAIQRATPSSLGSDVLAARLLVAAVALVLVLLGSSASTPLLVGVLSLAMIGFTVFEGSAAERDTDAEVDESEA